eukprot:jgi/Botrbrau1/21571/Bobra.174_2s0068.2
MSQLPTSAQVKQGARQLFSVATDKVKVVSANVQRGDTSGLDVAVIKATTSQFHVPPKEKHVRTLKGAVHPEQGYYVTYVIKELVKRLHLATDWLTALKTLMVIHRLMRECDISFIQQLLKYSDSEKHTRHQQKGSHILNMDNFIDTTNIEGRFEFSEYVRGYGKYLDEQLEVYARINFYLSPESTVEQSRLRSLNGKDLLFQLPVLQHLLTSLVSCKPSNLAGRDEVVQASLLLVVKEGLGLYKVISEGIINVSDKFFDMEYLDAVKGLEIYKQAVLDFSNLQGYLRHVEQIDGLRGLWQSPQLRPIPPDFVEEMEAYIKEAPRALDGDTKKSPPLRKGKVGSKIRHAREPMSFPAVSPDPGMIGPYTKPESPAAAPPPDLLDLETLSISDPPLASTASQPAGVDLLDGLQTQFTSSGSTQSFGSAPFANPAPSLPQPSAAPSTGGSSLPGSSLEQGILGPSSGVAGVSVFPSLEAGNGSAVPAPPSTNPFGFSHPTTPNQATGSMPYSPAPQSQAPVFPLSPAAAEPLLAPAGQGVSPARPPLGAASLKKDSALDDPFASLLPPKAAKPQLTLKQMSPASSTKSSPGFAPVTPAPSSTPPQGLGVPGFSPAGLLQGTTGGYAVPSPNYSHQAFHSTFSQPVANQASASTGAITNGFQTSFEPQGTSSLI